MFRAALWTLRQPRYAALAAGLAVLAAFCFGAGAFELHRFHEKRSANARLHANTVAPPTALTPELVPLTGEGSAPGALAVRYRTVTATGRYLPAAQTYLDDQSQGGRQGFAVVTPLRTADGVLLVARGFVAATADEARPARVAAPPTGLVRVTGRLQTAASTSDRFGALQRQEITAVNPARQAARLGARVYQSWLSLSARQPGGAGLTALPDPPTSNPTGGASEWQLMAYVVQWWVFGVLAVLAPFAICRAEVREARRRFLGVEDATEFDLMLDPPTAPALEASGDGESGGASGAAVAVRGAGTLARPQDVPAAQWERAGRLADRYGRSLGPAGGRPLVRPVQPPAAPAGTVPSRRSAAQPHRSDGDAYHGGYNDYLWHLALRDGEAPAGPELEAADRPEGPEAGPRRPRVIDSGSGADDL